ncbi:DMT family transporter [Tardiphaga alba]|uniref:DMT family transporter n=1 Tax=Tardiphaga alba TaxID=340268 RepID=A0ABX8ACY7_9BRAD|nr:DMT family transporter [Tardiphaga alba]QUS41166.1 DMT family transporter [Tardiphaga alba]
MTTPAPPRSLISWFANQPYLLLSLTSLFWAGNIVLGRFVAGHVPPITLSCVRWIGAFLLMLPFAWTPLRKDWPVIRKHIPLMLLLALTGFAANTALAYAGLQYTQALNGLLIQSSGPLYVALWSLILFGIRLSLVQLLGIVISMTGVFVILLRGDLTALAGIEINKGDAMLAGALLVFGIYSAMMIKRPVTHPMSLIAVTTGFGALMTVPVSLWELNAGRPLILDTVTFLALAYAVIFPSTLAYLFFNRGIALIGPNRAAPFLQLMPVFGSVMAIAFLGETLQLFHLTGYVLVLSGVFIASRR